MKTDFGAGLRYSISMDWEFVVEKGNVFGIQKDFGVENSVEDRCRKHNPVILMLDH
jgi:hypothetical protein